MRRARAYLSKVALVFGRALGGGGYLCPASFAWRTGFGASLRPDMLESLRSWRSSTLRYAANATDMLRQDCLGSVTVRDRPGPEEDFMIDVLVSSLMLATTAYLLW